MSRNAAVQRHIDSLPLGVVEIVRRLRDPNLRYEAYYGGTNLEPYMRLVDQLIEAKLGEWDLWRYEQARYQLERELQQVRYEVESLKWDKSQAREALR